MSLNLPIWKMQRLDYIIPKVASGSDVCPVCLYAPFVFMRQTFQWWEGGSRDV